MNSWSRISEAPSLTRWLSSRRREPAPILIAIGCFTQFFTPAKAR
jgi:hypothetical protein